MRPHDPRLSLLHMRDAAEEAINLGKGHSGAELEGDHVLSLALCRLLAILGEAANRVPKELQEQNSNLPWREMIGLRNLLVHAYDIINLDIVASIVNTELETLVAKLNALLETWSEA
jgi:uncharacterized protein with HEPN domain